MDSLLRARWLDGPILNPTSDIRTGSVRSASTCAALPGPGRPSSCSCTAAGAEVDFHPVDGGRHFWQGVEDTHSLFDRAIAFTTRFTTR